MLEKSGARVNCVANGRLVLDALDKQSYDIILMDCHMPLMDGFEATFNIRSRSTVDSQIPIIAVTADAMKEDQKKCLDSGMNGYIAKPYKSEDLCKAILQWVNKKKDFQDELNLEEDYRQLIIIDQKHFAEQEKAVGDSFAGIVQDYIKAVSEAVDTINKLCKKNDLLQLTDVAHKIKGASGTVGAIALHDVLVIIEKQIKNNEKLDDRVIEKLERISSQTIQVLSEM
jgi:CheY-like chemotaxis protein/HPt (histidine-containing phosphotransfer) domain-containing protein